MQNILTIILILASHFFCLAQNHRFIYEVTSKNDSTSKMIARENYYLDISKDRLEYYNRLYYINDSIHTKNGGFGFKDFKLSSFIIKNLNEKKYQNFEYIGDANIYKIENEVNFEWKIDDSIKIINDLKVQKATAKFGKRNWTAWFCPDLIFPFGPYKFNGLPGLIIEIYDDKKDHFFKLIKSESYPFDYQSDTLANLQNHPIKIDTKKLNSLKLDLYSNPFKYVLNGMMSIPEGKKLLLDDGTVLTKSQLKPAEKKERIKLKSFNNPIELDKAVIYPDKK